MVAAARCPLHSVGRKGPTRTSRAFWRASDTGLRAKLYDGSYHPVTSEMAFKTAARIAYKQCINRRCCLSRLCVEISVPDSTGRYHGWNKRRGRITAWADDGRQLIIAEVPQAEMFKYATDLRSMTQAKGSFKMSFERYEEVPQAIAAKIIEAHKADLADDDE
ncbi:MAG: hypothetical protein ACLVJB_08625 [Christensenellales bacterium]